VNYNRVILAGNLTRDWEVRQTQGGMAVGKSGFAVNRKTRDKEETMFVDIVAFGQVAETLSKHTGKGRPLLVEGRLNLQQWEDQSGNRRSKHEVVLENFQFGSTQEGYRAAVQVEEDRRRPSTPDDVPF